MAGYDEVDPEEIRREGLALADEVHKVMIGRDVAAVMLALEVAMVEAIMTVPDLTEAAYHAGVDALAGDMRDMVSFRMSTEASDRSGHPSTTRVQ